MTYELNPALDLDACLGARHRQHHFGMVKTEEDVVRYSVLIHDLKPSLIVEVGTFSGKSALWFANFASVLTIDVSPIAEVEPATPPLWEQAPNEIRQHVGRSDSVEALTAVMGACLAHRNGDCILVLDGDHSAPTVSHELDMYARYFTAIVVEDTLLRWFPEDEQVYDGNPLDALEAWLPAHPEWEIDRELEGLHPVTQFPGGWLKRVGE